MTMQTDKAGQVYTSPDTKPASDGTAVTIHSSNGPVSGTMRGGTAHPNTKSN